MTEAYSFASVTVASNAARRLPRQLDALKRQTRKIDEIVVVDNASSDGTVDMLEAQHPDVTVLKLPENGGVGAGYAAGLKHAAITKRHTWIWLLDDDSVPPRGGLQSLLEGLGHVDNRVPEIAIVAPVCFDMKTSTSWPGMSWQGGCLVPTPVDSNELLTFVDCVISSGSLIQGKAVEVAGLPRADFFMDFVDYEYCLRLRRYGFRIAVVRDSILEHEIGTLSVFKFLGWKRSWANHAPWREYYMARNETFTMWHDYPRVVTKGFVLYRLTRHALGILLFSEDKLACLKMQWRGFTDGRAGRLGIRFLPGKSETAEKRRLLSLDNST
jgi:GT2 family glycosyltransferase